MPNVAEIQNHVLFAACKVALDFLLSLKV